MPASYEVVYPFFRFHEMYRHRQTQKPLTFISRTLSPNKHKAKAQKAQRKMKNLCAVVPLPLYALSVNYHSRINKRILRESFPLLSGEFFLLLIILIILIKRNVPLKKRIFPPRFPYIRSSGQSGRLLPAIP